MEKNRGKRKKLLSAVLCFLMVASLMMPIFAAGIDGAYEESGDKVNEQQELSGGSSGSENAAIKDGDTEELCDRN